MDLANDADYADNSKRSANRQALKQRLDTLLSTRTAAEWTPLIMAAGVPAGPVYTLDQVFADPHVRATGMVETMHDPELGPIETMSNPLRLSSIGPQTVRAHAPRLGEHSTRILDAFAFTEEEIARLVDTGAVMTHQQG